MTQRQLNMIQAMEEGIEMARRDLRGVGANLAISKAMSDICDAKPKSMSLAATAYYTAMYMAWKTGGCLSPDELNGTQEITDQTQPR